MTGARWRALLLLALCVGLVGSRPKCDGNAPTLRCDALTIQVEPGTCKAFDNPCGDRQWQRLDGFQLCDAPPGLIVQSERRPRGRFLCASPSAAPGVELPVDYYYVRTTDSGEGRLYVTIGGSDGLDVTAAAFPGTILPGAKSLLLVTSIRNGTPPYTFSWMPADTLDRPMAPDPLASPPVTTRYTVTVTDASGAQSEASVTVFVGFSATVAAEPEAIDVGQASQLAAEVGGGTEPYTFAWQPAAGLDDPSSATPVATPDVTTTYEVTVTDAATPPASASGSVTVKVRLEASASAAPTTIDPGQSAQLQVVPRGGTPPYEITWAPNDGSLDDFRSAMPVATPAFNTLYLVTVSDATGVFVQQQVPVYLTGQGALGACFTATPFGQGQVLGLLLDARCSTGSILEYRWWYDFVPGEPPDAAGIAPCCEEPVYLAPGTKQVRLEVMDDTGATAALVMPVDVQP